MKRRWWNGNLYWWFICLFVVFSKYFSFMPTESHKCKDLNFLDPSILQTSNWIILTSNWFYFPIDFNERLHWNLLNGLLYTFRNYSITSSMIHFNFSWKINRFELSLVKNILRVLLCGCFWSLSLKLQQRTSVLTSVKYNSALRHQL